MYSFVYSISFDYFTVMWQKENGTVSNSREASNQFLHLFFQRLSRNASGDTSIQFLGTVVSMYNYCQGLCW